ncbi:unnamed protein product [Bemisia tabaci]|uniref:Uncharacterized protein n=1 Tax=Bemisia tabaci TaxID=7038 RepID=A0A9P0C6N6_BEMTA|nr:unnamed protein product [Bemisia tabaci]
MADRFRSIDAQKLLAGKKVLLLGDSNIRSVYKDLVWFVQHNKLIPDSALKQKLERSHAKDQIVKGDRLHKGRDFTEDRSYHDADYDTLIEYSFITQCYSDNVVGIFEDIKSGELDYDLIIMNSTIWDISRWGPRGIDLFKENLINLMKLVSSSLPEKCMFVWLTALPVSRHIRSVFLVEEIHFLESFVRFMILEANNYARQIIGTYGYDVLDLHFYMRMQQLHMKKDGLHYEPVIMRFISNLILTHCSLSWNVRLPGNVQNIALKNVVSLAYKPDGFKEYIDVQNMLEQMEKVAPNKSSVGSKKKSSSCNEPFADQINQRKLHPLLSGSETLGEALLQSSLLPSFGSSRNMFVVDDSSVPAETQTKNFQIKSINQTVPKPIKLINQTIPKPIKLINKTKPKLIKLINQTKPKLIKLINQTKPKPIKLINQTKSSIQTEIKRISIPKATVTNAVSSSSKCALTRGKHHHAPLHRKNNGPLRPEDFTRPPATVTNQSSSTPLGPSLNISEAKSNPISRFCQEDISQVSSQRVTESSHIPKCALCRSYKHDMFRCAKWQTSCFTTRLRYLAKCFRCTKCLSQEHSTSGCKNKERCGFCGEDHHTMYHSIRKSISSTLAAIKKPTSPALPPSVSSGHFFLPPSTQNSQHAQNDACLVRSSVDVTRAESSQIPHSYQEIVPLANTQSNPISRFCQEDISQVSSQKVTKSSHTPRCTFCRSYKHDMFRCAKFASLSVPTRLRFLARCFRCIKCISNQHSSSLCKNKERCGFCGEDHYTLFHSVRRKPISSTHAAVVQPTSPALPPSVSSGHFFLPPSTQNSQYAQNDACLVRSSVDVTRAESSQIPHSYQEIVPLANTQYFTHNSSVTYGATYNFSVTFAAHPPAQNNQQCSFPSGSSYPSPSIVNFQASYVGHAGESIPLPSSSQNGLHFYRSEPNSSHNLSSVSFDNHPPYTTVSHSNPSAPSSTRTSVFDRLDK